METRNPASRAISTALSAPFLPWARPRNLSTGSWKLCTPRERRFTPRSLRSRRRPGERVPGLASRVTSAPLASRQGRLWKRATSSRSLR